MITMGLLYFLSTDHTVTHTILIIILFFMNLLSMMGATGTLIHRDKKDWIVLYRVSSVCTVLGFYILVGILIGFGYNYSNWNCENPDHCAPGEAWEKWWQDPWNLWYVSSLCVMSIVAIFSCCWSRQQETNQYERVENNYSVQGPASETDLSHHKHQSFDTGSGTESEGSLDTQ